MTPSRSSTLLIGLACLLLAAVAHAQPGEETDTPSAEQTPTSESDVLADYRAALDRGIVNNNLGRYNDAEDAFRQASSICQSLYGTDSPTCGDPLLRLALEVSNQRRFEEAEMLFRQAESLCRQAASPLIHPRFLTYRAMDLANRGAVDDAYQMAVDANAERRTLLPAAVDTEALIADLTHGLFVQAALALRLDKIDEATLLAHLTRPVYSQKSLV